MKECFELLKKYKSKLTRQQVKTLKGQILSNDLNGFKKGLAKTLKKGSELNGKMDR